jgi:hypothetical protein
VYIIAVRSLFGISPKFQGHILYWYVYIIVVRSLFKISPKFEGHILLKFESTLKGHVLLKFEEPDCLLCILFWFQVHWLQIQFADDKFVSCWSRMQIVFVYYVLLQLFSWVWLVLISTFFCIWGITRFSFDNSSSSNHTNSDSGRKVLQMFMNYNLTMINVSLVYTKISTFNCSVPDLLGSVNL